MIYLSNCIHQSGEDERYPKWDTLIGIFNKNYYDIKAQLNITKEDGVKLPIIEFTIKAHSSFALTFIPNNGLPNPPQDFIGHATLNFVKQTPFGWLEVADSSGIYCWSMLAGGNWDSKSPSIENPCTKYLYTLNEFIFPYAIPHYENSDHPNEEAYVTGLNIQNFSEHEVDIAIIYTVGQAYGELGKQFNTFIKVPANGGLRIHLHELFPDVCEFNSEGHVVLTASPSAKLYCTQIIATRNYIFSAAQVAQ